MKDSAGLWFVYRSHYEGPLSRRIRKLDAPSLRAWLGRMMNDARSSKDPSSVYEAELGGYVYGFGTIFEATHEHALLAPKSTAELEKLLKKHLYVEGEFRVDDQTLRVSTDDDEVSLAYFFFDDETAKTNPDRVAWLLHDEPRLPDGEGDGNFTPPMELERLTPVGDGEGTTYACLFTFYDGDSIPGKAVQIPGVRLPDLASHLRNVTPSRKTAEWSKEWLETWPVELRLLRAMIEPGQISIAPALNRCAAYPLRNVASGTNHSHLGVGAHATARSEFEKVSGAFKHGGDPSKTVVHVGKHAALFCPHTSTFFGHEQWVFFDDLWASAHPALAKSLLRYASTWDPFRDPKPRREPTEAERNEEAWKKVMTPREGQTAVPYRASEKFVLGQVIDHSKFGRGLVNRVESGKIEVIFQTGTRLLAHDLRT